MGFNSIQFLVFFSVFFVIFWKINKVFEVNISNAYLVCSSYLFYACWDYRFLSLILFSTISDYMIGNKIYRSKNKRRRYFYLLISIFFNLGLLCVFKYFNFFIESFNVLFNSISIPTRFTTVNIILPIGISFYTFQTLSYTIDIYRKKIEPANNVIAFAAFVSFFPQLVAGPIERAKDFLGQFLVKKVWNYSEVKGGLRLVLWGFTKKIVIADQVGILVNNIYALESSNGLMVLLGTFLFGIQIYTDFSAYSDIAIGLGRMLGFHLRKNFITPYFSFSFQEFWSRWHISLSTWFRDYVYISMGGCNSPVYNQT